MRIIQIGYEDRNNEDENKERFPRDVFEINDNGPQAEYYNDWIMENLG